VGASIAILVLAQEYRDYTHEHISNHHSVRHMTMDDPTASFMIERMGLRPGMSSRSMWRRLFITILSPQFHLQALALRIKSHLVDTKVWYRALFGALVIAEFVGLAFSSAASEILISWVFPVPVLYNSAAHQREHQRAAPAVLPERHRPVLAHPGVLLETGFEKE
jgi:hypothetical protein